MLSQNEGILSRGYTPGELLNLSEHGFTEKLSIMSVWLVYVLCHVIISL